MPTNVLLDPAAHGWPDQTTVGTIGGLSAPEAGGIDVTTPGTIIEDREIDGTSQGYGLFVNAENVIIRNCLIYTTPGPAGGCVVVNDTLTGRTIIEDCEFFYTGDGSYDAIVRSGQYTMRRCYIHDFSEGPRANTEATIENCYIAGAIGNNVLAHSDLVQCTGGNNVIINHNTFRATYEFTTNRVNAVAILGSELAPSNNIQFTNNLLGGVVETTPDTASPGFSLQMGPTNPFDTAIVYGNRWGRDQYDFGPHSIDPGITNFFWGPGNVFDDTEEPVPTPAGTQPFSSAIGISNLVGPTLKSVPILGSAVSRPFFNNFGKASIPISGPGV